MSQSQPALQLLFITFVPCVTYVKPLSNFKTFSYFPLQVMHRGNFISRVHKPCFIKPTWPWGLIPQTSTHLPWIYSWRGIFRDPLSLFLMLFFASMRVVFLFILILYVFLKLKLYPSRGGCGIYYENFGWNIFYTSIS